MQTTKASKQFYCNTDSLASKGVPPSHQWYPKIWHPRNTLYISNIVYLKNTQTVILI